MRSSALAPQKLDKGRGQRHEAQQRMLLLLCTRRKPGVLTLLGAGMPRSGLTLRGRARRLVGDFGAARGASGLRARARCGGDGGRGRRRRMGVEWEGLGLRAAGLRCLATSLEGRREGVLQPQVVVRVGGTGGEVQAGAQEAGAHGP